MPSVTKALEAGAAVGGGDNDLRPQRPKFLR